jgi:hypothetical protein
MERLKAKYEHYGVEFVVVYVREPHPGEPAYRKYQQPQTLVQRRQYAQELATTRQMNATIVVDTMNDEISERFGSLPNMVYVIDRQGVIAYSATWTTAEKIDHVLSVLTADSVSPTTMSA